jgi:hypothetical protein
VLIAALDQGAGPEITTGPLLLAGLGVGALASQLGSVTVSALPEERSGEVGGLQNTASNLGTSFGTALAGAVLIGALSSSFLNGLTESPDVPQELSTQASTELGGGVPFVANDDLEAALQAADVDPDVIPAIVDENTEARIVALRVSLATLALVVAAALFFANSLPTVQAADERSRPTSLTAP